MSKAEILSELPRLSLQDHAEILEHLWRLEKSSGATDEEKTTLNEALSAYDAPPTGRSLI